jgi:hypothetical protein
MNKLDKIIKIIRENMAFSGSGEVPTNNISSGNIDTFDPTLHFRKRKNGNLDGRSVSKKYKEWLKNLGHLK